MNKDKNPVCEEKRELTLLEKMVLAHISRHPTFREKVRKRIMNLIKFGLNGITRIKRKEVK